MIANPKLHALSREFAKFPITVPAVFAPGDTLDANAASWVNGQIATAIGNQFSGILRRANEAGKPVEFTDTYTPQDHFNELFEEYSFSGNRGSGTGAVPRDPIAALVQFLAKEAIKAKIKAKGLKVKDFMSAKVDVGGEEVSKFMLLVEEYTEKHPELYDTAKAQLDAADTSDDDLDLSLAAE